VSGRLRPRRLAPWLLLAAGIIAVALIAGRGNAHGGPPGSPLSTAPDGTRALVDSLRELGVAVDVTSEPPGRETTAVLVLRDGLGTRGDAEVLDWVRGGGTLVVADVRSPLNPASPAAADRVGGDALPRRCDVAALAGVARVEAPGDHLLDVPAGAIGCFRDGAAAWLVTRAEGRGDIVALGGLAPFTNERLGGADNGILAVTLLGPGRQARVTVLYGGRRTLYGLVGTNVKLALVQLLVAFVLLALWRARRLGRPVLELQPVVIPGSELVTAVGNLLQRAHKRDQVARLMADDLRRDLGNRVGLPPTAPPEQVADAVSARTGVPARDILAALAGAPTDDAGLVALAQAVESVRQEVASAR